MLIATEENGDAGMGFNILVPMLFMDSSTNNQNLLFYMMMMDRVVIRTFMLEFE